MNYIGLYFTISPLVPTREILIAELDQLGFDSFVETESGLEAYIQNDDFNLKLINDLWVLNSDEFDVSFELKELEDQNWNAAWEASFQPIEVDRFVRIRAPFHEKEAGYQYELLIKPQMSFGTGHHQTTWLILREMGQLNFKSKSVLDMGCGTGILGILAEKLGATSIEGVDIDQWAYENALENVQLNGCQKMTIAKGGEEAVHGNSFDIILANINKNVLLDQLSQYAAWLNQSGSLLLSGFFEQDANDLVGAANEYGLNLVHQKTKDEWCMLHLRKS